MRPIRFVYRFTHVRVRRIRGRMDLSGDQANAGRFQSFTARWVIPTRRASKTNVNT